VATYNIHRGKGTDGVRDLGRTAKVLADADVVGLNEVAGPTLPGQRDQAGRLGGELGIGWLFAPSQRRWHMYHFGNGLLSRLAVGRWTIEPLIHDKTAHSHRNVLTAEIMVGPQPVTVLITHIARNAIHPTQLRDVLTEFRKHTPAILIGDLNTTADHPLLINFFADSDNVDAIGVALAEADSSGRIDWIITRGMRVLAGGMEPTGVSDHPCYWVDVEVAGTTADASLAATVAER
jgi:endonuclease/exonuclease/phosphatase family metal-dependent hydrolase